MKIKRSAGVLAILISLGLYLAFLLFINRLENNIALRILWIFNYALNLLGMVTFVFHRRLRNLWWAETPVAEGKVICVIPAYNEALENLRDCINSILNQTVEIGLICVVDDGSKIPVHLPEFEHHERVRLIRQDNTGKRGAQATALRGLDTDAYPFLLTVDSDSVLAPDALEYMLREMSDYKVKACTASILALNYDANILTKMQEMNYGASFTIARSTSRTLGFFNTTSGACALYRTEIICFHLDDYLENGKKTPTGDDRRMAIYSSMEGKVAYVAEAVAYTEVPEKLKVLWKQRKRWDTGAWAALPHMVVNLGFKKSLYGLQRVIGTILVPLYLIISGYYSYKFQSGLFFFTIMYTLLTSYTNTLFYILSRPLKPFRRKYWFLETPSKFKLIANRFFDWIFITPVLVLFSHTISLMTKYVGLGVVLFKRNKGWGTR